MNYPKSQDRTKAGRALATSQTLLTALKTPHRVTEFSLDEWSLLIRQAQRTKLLSRIAEQSKEHGTFDQLPFKVADTLQGALYMGSNNRRMIDWEIKSIQRALVEVDTPIVLLKGGAYVVAGLPAANGRIANDIDIMVPEPKLLAVEAALLAQGWSEIKFSDYDQRYYRKWSHELPPLRHEMRKTVVDVHHTILPRTSRLKPDTDKLWQHAVDVPGTGVKTLGPQDMVLHSSAHLFQDGEVSFAIRDLVDLVDLLRHFGAEPGFWDGLVDRAYEHQLQRPLYYTLRYGQMLLDLEVPDVAAQAIAAAAPAKPLANMMDRIMPRVLLPDDPNMPSITRGHAASLLYLRSHWLRMPPWLLAGHLTTKAVMQLYASYLQWREEEELEEEDTEEEEAY